MRGRLGMLGLVIVLAACGSAAAGSHAVTLPGTNIGCGPPTARTLAASRMARVYVVGDTVYGCAYEGSKTYRLGRRSTCVASKRVTKVLVVGKLAAYALERCGVDTGSTAVVVRRLTDGRQLRDLRSTTMPLPPESYESVTSLLLKHDGAVAWIAVGKSIVGHGAVDIEVHKADKDGRGLLDSGPTIEPSSLRLHRWLLSWKHGNATLSASLH